VRTRAETLGAVVYVCHAAQGVEITGHRLPSGHLLA
jgi:hypothetical protein